MKTELEIELKKQTSDFWLRALRDAGVPVAPILDIAEAARLPQTTARNMLVDAGGITMPGNPIKISGYADPHLRAGAPGLDEHGVALRVEFAALAPVAVFA